jgi:GDP/UDP-N,N'-diacetylbacillosamine 2-epimerase (hydrolysing)
MARRHICYVSGTRADFGLMRSTLARIHHAPALALSVVATGMHLDPLYGHTVDEIEQAGFALAATIEVPTGPPSGATMARHIGIITAGLVDAFEKIRPDAVLLLGDRGEMLAAAIAAIHLNLPIVHIAGGDRSGTVDEPVRHAISKLAHFHLTSTEASRERLVRMGEHPDRVLALGTPSLDDIVGAPVASREEVARELGLRPDRPFALMVFHPVLQDAENAGRESAAILAALDRAGLQTVALMPNSDAGSEAIRQALEEASTREGFVLKTHLPREAYLSVLANADLMIGNSSSGIVEAASFGTQVVNVGPRQALRERNANITDVGCDAVDIGAAIEQSLASGRLPAGNIYGDGRSGERIRRFLEEVELGPEVLRKVNAY